MSVYSIKNIWYELNSCPLHNHYRLINHYGYCADIRSRGLHYLILFNLFWKLDISDTGEDTIKNDFSQENITGFRKFPLNSDSWDPLITVKMPISLTKMTSRYLNQQWPSSRVYFITVLMLTSNLIKSISILCSKIPYIRCVYLIICKTGSLFMN